MRISVLIVTKTFQEKDIAFKHDLISGSDGYDYEVLVGTGDNPSLQRNKLAEAATGEYLLFLDNDSAPQADLLEKYAELVSNNPDIKVFGGPSLLTEEKDEWNRVLQLFFTSPFGIGPFRSRYNSTGPTRLTDEKELILSNLFVQRDYFLDTGGFNKNFYPGEENEFLKRNHVKALYEPTAAVYRSPRKNIADLMEQMLSYGKGRAKHFTFSRDDLIFLAPAMFAFYAVFVFLNPFLFISTIPVGAYLFIVGVIALFRLGMCVEVFIAPFVFGLAHLFYGLGIWTGIVRYKLFKQQEERALSYFEIIKLKSFSIF